jgi:hypothetical protein
VRATSSSGSPEDIALLQKNPARHADCFLTPADINAAGDETASVKTRELFLENPRLKHDAERLEVFLVRHFFRSAAFGGLKHLRFSH